MKEKLLFAAIILGTASVNAQIKDADFKAAMEQYLKTEDGAKAVAVTVKEYFQQEQKRMMEQAAAKEKAELEQYYKNPMKVNEEGSPSKGPADAKVTIYEFSDFQCPYCARGKDTVYEVLKLYPNDVRLVFKNLPLEFHAQAANAAKAALAAGKQGKYWEYHDQLFAKQSALKDSLYEEIAKELKLDVEKFKIDYASKEIADLVEKDTKEAQALGFRGTPGFVVGGVPVKGAYPVETFKEIIDKKLGKSQ